MQDLLNAPPRLSDIHGDERVKALAARKRAHDANWRRTRVRRGLLARVAERLTMIRAAIAKGNANDPRV